MDAAAKLPPLHPRAYAETTERLLTLHLDPGVGGAELPPPCPDSIDATEVTEATDRRLDAAVAELVLVRSEKRSAARVMIPVALSVTSGSLVWTSRTRVAV